MRRPEAAWERHAARRSTEGGGAAAGGARVGAAGIKLGGVRVEPLELIADAYAAAPHLRDRPVGAVHHLLAPECLDAGVDAAGLADGREGTLRALMRR